MAIRVGGASLWCIGKVLHNFARVDALHRGDLFATRHRVECFKRVTGVRTRSSARQENRGMVNRWCGGVDDVASIAR